jgi:hypothetical protein
MWLSESQTPSGTVCAKEFILPGDPLPASVWLLLSGAIVYVCKQALLLVDYPNG